MDDNDKHLVLDKIFRRDKLLPSAVESRPDFSIPIPIPPPPLKKENPFTAAIAKVLLWFRGTPYWEKNLTTLFYGPRSNGKSLHQAKAARSILKWLDDLYLAYPELPQAIMVSNQKFSKTIEEKYLGKRLFYWESIQQLKSCPRPDCWKAEINTTTTTTIANPKLVAKYSKKPLDPKGIPKPAIASKVINHPLHDCYMLIDDAATIIPADGWQDLPVWFRKVFAQAGHNGVHVLANIQDPISCDINFRRYVDLAFKIQKIMGNRRPEAGKPPVRAIWGVYSSREIPADELWKHGDKTEAEIQQEQIDRELQNNLAVQAGQKVVKVVNRNWRKSYHLIRRGDTEIYDTLQNVPAYMPGTMEHIEIVCNNPDCGKIHVRHRVI
jgi:hypothetical protein